MHSQSKLLLKKGTGMKRKFNLFFVITFAFFCFMPLKVCVLEAETFTYTYDDVGNMILKDGDDDDNDGITNADEISYGTDPQNEDSDYDNMPDGWEVAYGLNPLSDDANVDPDNDGVSNYDEYIAGTNPNIPYDLVLANETISTGTVNYQAENSIIAGPAYIVESGADISCQAGNIIILKSGFTASEGSLFHAFID